MKARYVLLKENAPLLAAGSPNPKRGIPKGAWLPLVKGEVNASPAKGFVLLTLALLVIVATLSFQFVTIASNKSESSESLQQIFLKWENSKVYVQDISLNGRYRYLLKEIGKDFIKIESIEEANAKTDPPEIFYLPFTSIKYVRPDGDGVRIAIK